MGANKKITQALTSCSFTPDFNADFLLDVDAEVCARHTLILLFEALSKVIG